MRVEVVVVFVAVLAILFGVCLTIMEQREWDAFAVAHHCEPVEYMKGGMRTAIGPNMSSGGSGITMLVITDPDKICYQCDDGKRYWR